MNREHKLHDTGVAIRLVKRGRLVRRLSWPEGINLRIVTGTGWTGKTPVPPGAIFALNHLEDHRFTKWEPDSEELLAEDWVEVINKG